MEKNGSHTIYGYGNQSCGSFTSTDRSTLVYAAFENWLAGAISVYNLMAPTDNILTGTDMRGALGWIANYCSSNHTDSFAKAVNELTLFMYRKPQ
jgi:hypothetical protein